MCYNSLNNRLALTTLAVDNVCYPCHLITPKEKNKNSFNLERNVIMLNYHLICTRGDLGLEEMSEIQKHLDNATKARIESMEIEEHALLFDTCSQIFSEAKPYGADYSKKVNEILDRTDYITQLQRRFLKNPL